MFVNAAPADTPTSRALLHTWADNLVFTNRGWEVLRTGQMQDNPAAISWGPGRTDVFVRGGGGELVHKSFANGRWSGWEDPIIND